MIKNYLVVSYAIMVRNGKWVLEPEDENDTRPVVPEDYIIPVSEYLINTQK